MLIAIIGLPGSGKATIAGHLVRELSFIDCVFRINSGRVRREVGDWDFSEEGRVRQMRRLRRGAAGREGFVIVDFIAATNAIREEFAADYQIWVDTLSVSRYKDTNLIFQRPLQWDWRVSEHMYDYTELVNDILKRRTT